MRIVRHPPHRHPPDIHHNMGKKGHPPHHVRVMCGGCPISHTVWWMSDVVDVWCSGCLVWWMSHFTHGVVDVLCGGCHFLPIVWWLSGVVDVLFYPWCGGCLVWWMSSVVDVCVVGGWVWAGFSFFPKRKCVSKLRSFHFAFGWTISIKEHEISNYWLMFNNNTHANVILNWSDSCNHLPLCHSLLQQSRPPETQQSSKNACKTFWNCSQFQTSFPKLYVHHISFWKHLVLFIQMIQCMCLSAMARILRRVLICAAVELLID